MDILPVVYHAASAQGLKTPHVPVDDQDLVDKYTLWVKQFGVEKLQMYHPHLVKRVERM